MIKISYAPDEEMISISSDFGTAFYGNYSDLPKTPIEIYNLLRDVTDEEIFIDKDLPLIG